MRKEKYLYNGKEVVYTNSSGGLQYTYQLNDQWLAVTGTGTNAYNSHSGFSFTYNGEKQLTESKITVPRDNSTQTFYENWYYTNGVCDSFAATTSWAGITYRTSLLFEYDLTKQTSIIQHEWPLQINLAAEIFGKQRLKYLLKKTIYYANGVNFPDNNWRYEYQYDGSGRVTERKTFSGSNTGPDANLTESYTYN